MSNIPSNIQGTTTNQSTTPENQTRLNYDKYLKTLLKSIRWSWIPLVIGIVLVLLGVPFEDMGPFGDFFAGSTVPVLTLISSIGVILTLRMQQEQLELQRTELHNSVEEMIATKLEIQEQGKTMAMQRFENTFFNMLTLHNEIVRSLVIRSEREINGRAIFEVLIKEMHHWLGNALAFEKISESLPSLEKIKKTYTSSIFDEFESQLGHYFRNLYRIVKFVDESKFSKDEKRNYIGIIKAQLSSYELVILLYNGLSEYGEDFLPLMKKYNLLDNLNEDHLNLTADDVEIFRTYAKGQ
ncbi:putative phage abortive infection protein [Priestia megaterium]